MKKGKAAPTLDPLSAELNELCNELAEGKTYAVSQVDLIKCVEVRERLNKIRALAKVARSELSAIEKRIEWALDQEDQIEPGSLTARYERFNGVLVERVKDKESDGNTEDDEDAND